MLNGPAQDIVERRMAQGAGPWLFPSVKASSRPQYHGLPLWYAVRREAGIEDMRLHDLRHTVASQAADERRAAAGRRPHARAQQCEHDHALRPCRRTARSRLRQSGSGQTIAAIIGGRTGSGGSSFTKARDHA